MFDRFAICEAAYLFAAHYHDGQFSKIYRMLGRLAAIGFRPSPSLRLETASEETKAAYGRLVKKAFPSLCGWQRRAGDHDFTRTLAAQKQVSFAERLQAAGF